MKIKKGFELRDICGEHIIIAHGVENINFTKVITLNESASFIWNTLKDKEFGIDDMVEALCGEYEVDAETARRDCEKLVEDWLKAELVEA